MYNLLKIGNTCINKSFKEDNMRRDNRKINSSKVDLQNKIMMYSIIGIAVLIAILVGLLLYSRSLSQEMQNDAIDFGDMANIEANNTAINSTNRF